MKNPIILTDCLHNCDRVCVSTFENSTLAHSRRLRQLIERHRYGFSRVPI